MLSLAAVQPHGLGVVDHDCEDGDHAHGLARVDGLEARVDALDAGVDVGDGDTSVVKGRLGDGVVAGPELELHHGTGLSGDLFRPELETGLVVGGVHAD